MADKAILDEAKKRFKQAMAAEAKQRDREKEVLRFQVGEYQWDAAARDAREGAGGTQPKRPMLSIPKTRQPLNLVRNQFRASQLGINIHPKNETSSKEGAEIRQDLIRTIEADGEGAENVLFWAMDRALQCGSGAFRIRNVWDEETQDPLDQKLIFERIFDQSLVLFDPVAQRADRSDGRFAFVLTWVPLDDFKEQFPNAKTDYGDDQVFEDLRLAEPEWVTGDLDTKAVLVAEYFRKESKTRRYVTLDDGSSGYDDELPAGRLVQPDGPSRDMQATKILIHKLTAAEGLETDVWPGKRYIPLVPTIGEELQPFDGERRRQGLVGPAMDACRGYNYAVTTAIEITALEPKAPVVGWEGQFAGHEHKWDTVNTHNWSYLEVRPTLLDGQPAPSLPQRLQADTSKLGMALQLAQQMDNDIQSSTNITDAALGRFEARRQSGKAIELLQNQADSSTSGYIQNMKLVSMPLAARILLDAMPVVYDRPGRIAQVIDAELRPRPIMLGKPFTIDRTTGMPIESREGVEGAKHYDLKQGAYGVTVNIGKAYQSRQQQGQEQLAQMIQAAPEMLTVFGDIWARFLDVPGSQELAARLLKVIETQRPGLTAKAGEAPSPEQLTAQLQAKDAELRQLQGMLAKATQAIETKMAEQQATMKKAEMDNASRQAVAEQNNAMKLILERLEAQTALMLKQMDLTDSERQRRHEVGLARVETVLSASQTQSESNANSRGEGEDTA